MNQLIPDWRKKAKPGVSLAQAKSSGLPDGLSRDLARILRPQAAYRWLLPQLAAITPQYIEMTLRGAMAGNHVQAWELFDLMEDSSPRLMKDLNELKGAVVGLDWQIYPYQEEDQPPSASAQAKMRAVSAAMRQMKPSAGDDENDFSATIYDLMDAWAKGQAVLEVDWQRLQAGSLGDLIGPRATYWVHPTCVSWDMSGRLGLRLELTGNIQAPKQKYTLTPGVWQNTTTQPLPSQVAPFPDDKFLVAIHKAKSGTALGGALLRPLAWWWCAANFSASWLLDLAQIFGLPFRWASYDPNAPQAVIDQVCAMLENMGSNAWAAFPAGTTIEWKEATTHGENSPQGDLLDRAEKQMDLLILGQTLTSDTGGSGGGGGSLALGKVHEGVKGEIVQAAGNWAATVLNTQLIPSILRLNFNDDSEAPEFRPRPKTEEDAKANADRDAVLLPMMPMPKAWFYKRHAVPLPEDGEETIGGVPPPAEDPQPTDSDEADDDAADGDTEDQELKAREAGLDDPALEASGTEHYAAAVASDMEHVRMLVAGLQEIGDDRVLAQRALEVADEIDRLKADILKLPASARALAEVQVAAFFNGLTEARKKEALKGGEFHGNQYVTIADEHWTGTPKEMHQRANAIMKGFAPVQHPELGEIKFTAEGRKKTLFDKRTPHEFQSVQALPELTRSARLVGTSPDRKGRAHVAAYHKLEHGLQIGQASYRAEITVKQTEDGGHAAHKFYLHRLTNE